MIFKHFVARVLLIRRFFRLVGMAREIELEWQKIQQDKNDAHFALHSLRGNAELEYIYRKGIEDGIKWCVKRFC